MAETSTILAEEALLRVKQLEVKFAHFEANTSMTDCCLTELDEELEEGRVSLEKLEKRVTELEAGLDPELNAGLEPELRTKGLLEKSLYKLTNRVSEIELELEKTELLEERVATLKTENAELRIHLNLVVDAVNNITRVWNEQVDQAIDNEPSDEVKAVDDDEPGMEDCEPAQQNPYVPEPDVFLPTFPFSPHPEPY